MKSENGVNLYSIFASEKSRLGAVFTVSYSNKKLQLKYALEGKGKMTVKFKKDSNGYNCEEFFFTPIDKPGNDILVFETSKNGQPKLDIKHPDMPDEMKMIIDGYTQPELRKKMGLDRVLAKAPKTPQKEPGQP